MALTTTREGMRKALDAMRIGRDPSIKTAEFVVTPDWAACLYSRGMGAIHWPDYGLQPGDKYEAEMCSDDRDAIHVRVTLREEAPTFVDLVAA